MKSKKSKISNEVKQIYDWLDSNIKEFNFQCASCGKCCHFDSFGHKLFVTTPELLYFMQNVTSGNVISSEPPRGAVEKSGEAVLSEVEGSKKNVCPYLKDDTPPHQFTLQRTNLKEHLKPIGLAFKTPHQSANWCGGKCTVRNFRFAGCRIFFCKADADLQSKLSEQASKKFKVICEKYDLPYRYIDLPTALSNPEMLNLIESL